MQMLPVMISPDAALFVRMDIPIAMAFAIIYRLIPSIVVPVRRHVTLIMRQTIVLTASAASIAMRDSMNTATDAKQMIQQTAVNTAMHARFQML